MLFSLPIGQLHYKCDEATGGCGSAGGGSVRAQRPVGVGDTCCDFSFLFLAASGISPGENEFDRSSREDCWKLVRILDALSLQQKSV